MSHPRTDTVTDWDEYPGHVDAVEAVEIRARVSGYLESIRFVDGAEVKAGDLLFTIDTRPYQADLDHARGERQRAESRLELALNDLRRAESLHADKKAISEEEYDGRSKAAREAEAALASAKAAELNAQINLDFTRISSPIDGRIGRRLITPGNLVQVQGSGGGGTVLATIVSMDPIYCYFDVEEGAFLRYRADARAARDRDPKEGVMACELALAGEEGYPHKGRVDFHDNRIDPRTGTIRMRGVFANADRTLMPGMFATVRVPAGPPRETLLVPAVAIGSEQGSKFVYVVKEGDEVETRSVTCGRTHGQSVSVLAGLDPRDRVVVNGSMLLRPGVKVQAREASTEARRESGGKTGPPKGGGSAPSRSPSRP